MIIFKQNRQAAVLKGAGAFFNQLKELPQSNEDCDCPDIQTEIHTTERDAVVCAATLGINPHTTLGSQLVIGAC